MDTYELGETMRQNTLKYHKIIQDNPQSIFTLITKDKVAAWQEELKSNEKNPDLTDESQILGVVHDINHQKVINNDIIRTRVRESVLVPNFKEILESLLIYFCKRNNVIYKQGLNEIFGAFLFLKYKVNISIIDVYNLAECFINKFMINYYSEEAEFHALNSSLAIFGLLIKYHLPNISNLLDKLLVTVQTFATNWFMTMMASKLRLDLLYQLWDHLIYMKDQLFLHYFSVALLKMNEKSIEQCEPSLLPYVLINVTINDTNQVDEAVQLALTIRTNTPYSFRIIANDLEIFKFGTKNLKKKFDLIQPDKIVAMPIFPTELLYMTYKPQLLCPDGKCSTNYNSNKDKIEDEKEQPKPKTPKKNKGKQLSSDIDFDISKVNSSANKDNKYDKKYSSVEIIEKVGDIYKDDEKYICEHCDLRQYKSFKPILIDLRILEYGSFETEDQKIGFLPNMIMIPQEELKLDDFPEVIKERFTPDKGNYHFVFLTSSTGYFSKFESNFYQEKSLTQEEEEEMRFKLQTKIDKELDKNKANNLIKLKDMYKLKEYDNLKNTLINLLNNNFPYVSFVIGGYEAVHKQAGELDLNLLNHEEGDCELCELEKQKEIERQKAKNENKGGLFSSLKNLFSRSSSKDSNDKRTHRGSFDYESYNMINEKPEDKKKDKKKEPEKNNSINELNTLWRHHEKVKLIDIEEKAKDQKNFLSPAVLMEYNDKEIDENKRNVLLVVIFDEYMIYIYSFDKKSYDYGKQITNINTKTSVFVRDSTQKGNELVLIEKIYFPHVKTINKDKDCKNILCILYKKSLEEIQGKNKNDEFGTIKLDLSTKNESNKFLKLMRTMSKDYAENKKLKKKESE